MLLEKEGQFPRVCLSHRAQAHPLQELILLSRCQRMMQANNQVLGSPSSRVNVTAQWAARGYSSFVGSRTLAEVGLRSWLHDRWQRVVFSVTLWAVDVMFWITSLKQRECLSSSAEPDFPGLTGDKSAGWEDRLQKQMENLARDEFGIEIDDTVFLG